MLTENQASARSHGDEGAMPHMMPMRRDDKRNGSKPDVVPLQQSSKVVRPLGGNVSRLKTEGNVVVGRFMGIMVPFMEGAETPKPVVETAPDYRMETRYTLREVIKYATDATAFGPTPRETIMRAVHKVIEEKASVSPKGQVTPAAWEKAMGECFDQSAAHYHLHAAHKAREAKARPWPSIKKALAHLDTMGIRERWHLTYNNTGISPEMWEARTGESFEASVAKRHFNVIQEKKKRNEGFNKAAMAAMARKHASSAGVQNAQDLEKKLQIKPETWEKVIGEPYAPLKGSWVIAGHHVGQDGKTMVPMMSFRLDTPVKIGPNCCLG